MNNQKSLAPIDQLRSSLKLMEPQFKMALPSHVPVEKFVRTIITAVQQNSYILDADRASLFSAAMKASQLGLLPDAREAAFVVFKGKVQFMPMIAGLLKLARNSGELSSITAQIVYEKDSFRYYVDSDGEHLNHEPNFFSDRGDILGAYALAKMKDGSVYIDVMTVNEILAVKNVSKSKDSGPWSGDFELEMYKKTVLRRLSKRLPMSTDLEDAVREDDYMSDIKQQSVYEEEKPVYEKKVSKKSRVESIVVSDNMEQKEVTTNEDTPI